MKSQRIKLNKLMINKKKYSNLKVILKQFRKYIQHL